MKDISEASASCKVTRRLLEKDVQKQCVDWARARGYWARKFSSQSQRSVPDYLFSRDWMQHTAHRTRPLKFFCEFKREGCPLKPVIACRAFDYAQTVMVMSKQAQYDEQQAMREAGWDGFECDNFDKFKATVLAYETEVKHG